ncbi:diguanylate cyclase [Sphingomonas cavernae]|nr:diguanylate cyclase [Sphingomonas cavernae]
MLVLLAALLSSPVAAMPDHARIHPTPCLRADTGGQTEADILSGSVPLDCGARQTRHGRGDFWVLLSGFSVTGSAEEPFVLRTASVWQDAVRLHILYADGFTAQVLSTSASTSPRIRPGAFIQYDLPVRSAPITAIVAHVQGSANVRGVLFSPEILPKSEAARRDLALTALYAGFLGLCLALLCYNLMMWAVMRRRFQIAYCAMLVAMMAYAFSSSGALAWVWPAIDNNDRLRINYGLLTLVVAAAIAFVRHFFEARIIPRWVLRLTRVATVTSLAATAAMVALAPWRIALLDTANSLALGALLFCAIPMIAFARIRRSRFLTVFLIAWAAPFLFAVIRVIANLGLLPPSFWIDNSTVMAMSAEALLSAVAIAYRIRLLSDERDSARASETLARLIAETDPVTGIANRRAFLAAAIGARVPQRLLLLHIDGFKEINDRIGHDGGDEVLRIVAETAQHFAPRDAPVARLGGIEFAILLPAQSAESFSPALLLERVRTAPMPSGIKVTVSIGIAEGPVATEDDWTSLYRDADRARYRASRDGGGRFRINLAQLA